MHPHILEPKLKDIEEYENRIITYMKYSYSLKELFDYPIYLISGKQRLTKGL